MGCTNTILVAAQACYETPVAIQRLPYNRESSIYEAPLFIQIAGESNEHTLPRDDS